ncbi:MAG: choice-of-anchor D domain-containing protein, partial [bacterium]|nr:choice-of-anchor D domain-containing protein [bacterium]
AAGARTAYIDIISDSPAPENTYTFDLRGYGGQPNINVVNYADDGDTAESAPFYEFGTIAIDSTTDAIVFNIENTGDTDLALTSITALGTNNGDFAVDTTGTSMTVAAGSSTYFTVAFTPGAAGARTAYIDIISDSPAPENTYTFDLRGYGGQPNINVVNYADDGDT